MRWADAVAPRTLTDAQKVSQVLSAVTAIEFIPFPESHQRYNYSLWCLLDTPSYIRPVDSSKQEDAGLPLKRYLKELIKAHVAGDAAQIKTLRDGLAGECHAFAQNLERMQLDRVRTGCWILISLLWPKKWALWEEKCSRRWIGH